jgi:hypothetical protein
VIETLTILLWFCACAFGAFLGAIVAENINIRALLTPPLRAGVQAGYRIIKFIF